jgi:hypothetical protein
MDAFLKSVAKYLYQHYQSDIQNQCLVFPSRRAGVFFGRYLSQMIDKPIWMPQIRTITELMRDMSGYQVGDPLSLIFNLYHIYREAKKNEDTFDEFYFWGEMLLNDFDDIDKYLVDAKQLFQNLSDLKEIEKQFTLPEEQIQIICEFWKNIKLHESSTLKDDFISVWTVLFNVYTKYREVLKSKGLAYEGMIYRDVYEKIKNTGNIETPYKRFAIIGFNALNACEKEFFKYLKKSNMADFFWDYDQYYVDNPLHEAGHFIRENLKNFPQPQEMIVQHTLTAPKNIEIIAIPSEIGQAKLIPNILERYNSPQSDLTETAVILSDEKLLIPVLTSIPENVKDVNVTLGYPLRFTPVYSFFEAIISLHHNLRQNAEGNVRFYHRDVTLLLNHPYVQMICPEETRALIEYIVNYNRIFVTSKELSKHEYLSGLFKIQDSSIQFIDYLIDMGSKTAQLLVKLKNIDNHEFHSEYWFSFITAINRLRDIIFKESIILEMPTTIHILRKMASHLSIPFRGEPLAGLQVMGMLETRTLDFVNVILLSANEGVLPKSSASTSFIPYNLRRGFGLPTIEYQDAVYAYYFYRLLQRAENVTLLYNSQTGKKTAEMSRFLFQLIYEPVFQVTKRSLNFQISLTKEKDITIPKTSEILKVLSKFTDQGAESRYLTPTGINAYLECSLRFYFRYVAQIQAKEDIAEDIEGSMFGKLLHNTMENMYYRYLMKTMSKADFDDLKNDEHFIEACILKAFAIEFFKKEDEKPQLQGKSLVVKEVLRKYILQILNVDKRLAPLTPLSFEETFQTELVINTDRPFKVRLGGKIDRIDQTGNAFRVIDYKTGNINRNFSGIDQLFEVAGKKQNKEVLQILLYSFILSEDKNYQHLPIVGGLYGMREIFKRDFDPRLFQENKMPINDFKQIREPYLMALKQLVSEIFEPAIPFTKVEDRKVCEFCDYKNICHR